MQTTQTRSHKSKSAPKVVTDPGEPQVAKSTQGKPERHPDPDSALSAQEYRMLIARAAYFRAERRGFAPGGELQDWVEAEAEVLRRFGNA